MKHKNLNWFIVGISVSLSAAVLARIEPWNYINSPDRLNTGYEKNFFRLPKEAEVSQKPWSDTYWPSDRGGLGWRWYSASGVNESPGATHYNGHYDYRSLLQMSKEQLSALSPIEKFDIVLGNIYPNRAGFYKWSKTERKRTVESGRRLQAWEGLCHGWAAASMNHAEPARVLTPVQVVDERDGQTKQIMLPFLSSDIKALMTYFYAELMNKPTAANDYKIIGLRCQSAGYSEYIKNGRRYRTANEECSDVNAGAFHVAVTNQIGIKRVSFIADLEPRAAVWNYPITGYRSSWLQERKPSASASKEAIREIVVETELDYMLEVNPYAYAFKGWDWQNARKTKVYRYTVELNAADQIVGGEWLTTEHPDFMWTIPKQEFTGDFAVLNHLFIQAE
jgi:hypothetical protein